MGRKIAPLSALAVSRKAKLPGLHAVGGVSGLYLCVTGARGRSWILRYTAADGSRRDMGLGSTDDLTLEAAREAARQVRAALRSGADPITERRHGRQKALAERIKAMTFDQCAAAFLEAHGDGWKNPKHRAQWESTLATYASPVFGRLDIGDVDTTLVLKALEPIWGTKTETASRLRGRIEQVLSWATVRGLRQGENPARWRGHLDQLLPARGKVQKVEHHAALAFQDIGSFLAELRQREGIAARALEFAILTAARSGEVRGMTWGELDLTAGVWTIPEGRMKAGREHRVPLSDEAVALLRALPRFGETDVVFPGVRGQPLSDMSLTAVLRRMGRGDLTAHGFRSTFRDWSGETTAYPREVIEHALAHQLKDRAEAAYARGSLFDKRRRLMADWARYCGMPQAQGEVVAIRAP